jgi:hypothetical protein
VILIVSCSENKLLGPGPARDIYTGPLTRLAIAYAELRGWTPYILSGKHGIITPDHIISWYNQRLKTYDGPWPLEKGYWIGGTEYFKNAPEYIKRFFSEGTSYCLMKSFLNKAVHPEKYGL